MSSSRGSNNGGGVGSIPAASRKMVMELKEIVNNTSEVEIYATLKDCHMDPNEAVNRLLSQGPYSLLFSLSLSGCVFGFILIDCLWVFCDF